MLVKLEDRITRLKRAVSADLGEGPDWITSDMSIRDALRASLRASAFKKLEPVDGDISRSRGAVELWLQMNDYCRDNFKIPDDSDYLDDILYTYRDLLQQSLDTTYGPVLGDRDAFAVGRHGPGASSGTKAKGNFEKLFWSDLSCTTHALYERYRHYVPRSWTLAERLRDIHFPGVVISTNRLFTVPKNVEIDRCATTVPSINMFFQLGAGELIQRSLWIHHRIDLSCQPNKNAYLARIGSYNGSKATIDLKSASDGISVGFAKWSLGLRNFRYLESINSRTTVIPKELSPTGDELTVEQNIFCTMGNGFTFPLQTLMFASLVKACYLHSDVPFRVKGTQIHNYSVFGDDIVVDREVSRLVVAVLKRCGFLVNEEKSYLEGPFRESCGKDFFRGYNVRGVYIRSLNNAADIYSAFNRIARWSVRHGIPMLNTLDCLRGMARFRPVPFDESDDAGFKWPSVFLQPTPGTPVGTRSYRALKAEPRRRRWHLNRYQVPGAYLAFLGGYVTYFEPKNGKKAKERDPDFWGGITYNVTAQTKSYQVVKGTTSSWDWMPHAGLTIRDYEDLVVGLDAVTG